MMPMVPEDDARKAFESARVECPKLWEQALPPEDVAILIGFRYFEQSMQHPDSEANIPIEFGRILFPELVEPPLTKWWQGEIPEILPFILPEDVGCDERMDRNDALNAVDVQFIVSRAVLDLRDRRKAG